MPAPRLSIILPTYNRAAVLPCAVAALLRQSAAREACEIIIVDNNSTDGTPGVLATIDDPRVQVVREGEQGLSHARNAGLRAARGDYVAFVDDDVEAAPDWAGTIIDSLDANPNVDGVGGRVLPSWTEGHPRWLTRACWAPLALQDHGDAQRVFDAADPIGLVGANIAFRRAALVRLGGFDASVQRVRDGIGSTEDHALLRRLYDAGGRMLYLPALLVMARIPPERCRRAYHRRWHAGHGRFHAIMRLPEVEASRMALLGVPGHLWRAAAHDGGRWATALLTGHRDAAFAAELRLRFFAGFLRQRAARRRARADRAGMNAEATR